MGLPRVRHNWVTEHSTQHNILLNYLIKMVSSYNCFISSCPFLDKCCHINAHVGIYPQHVQIYIYNLHEAESFHFLPPPYFSSWFTLLNFRNFSFSSLFPSHFSYLHSVATIFFIPRSWEGLLTKWVECLLEINKFDFWERMIHTLID